VRIRSQDVEIPGRGKLRCFFPLFATLLSSYRAAGAARLAPLFFLVLGLLFLPACSDPVHQEDIKPEGARLSPKQAIHIAKREAERHGVDLRDFKEPRVRYHSPSGRSWGVFFDGRVPTAGNNFLVFVDDRTEDAHYFPGK